MLKFEFEVERNTPEAEQFCEYLKSIGHTATIGDSNRVDGIWTATSVYASNVMNYYWDLYCKG